MSIADAASILPEAHRAAFSSPDPERIRRALSNVHASLFPTLHQRLVALGGAAAAMAAEESESRRLRMFVQRVQSEGPQGMRGILRRADKEGGLLVPWKHQSRLAESVFLEDLESSPSVLRTVRLVLWPTGAGKTNGANMVAAAAWTRAASASSYKALYVVPQSAVPQWHRSVLERLAFPEAAILVAYCKTDLTTSALARAKVVITTHSCLEAAFRDSHARSGEARKAIARSERPSSKQLLRNPTWDPQSPPPLHPFFQMLENAESNALSLAVWDEAEDVRNPHTFRAHLAREIFAKSAYGLMLSATPVGHRPSEWAAIIHALAVSTESGVRFSSKNTYLTARGNVSQAAIRDCYKLFVDFKKRDELDLPQRTDLTYSSEIFMPLEFVPYYNELVREAEAARSFDMMRAIMRLEQGAFHWRLMQVGARALSAEDVAHCVEFPSNSMEMLLRTVQKAQGVGRERVICYCQHGSVNRISRAYFDHMGSAGATFLIDGDLDRPGERDEIARAFLAQPGCAVLFITSAGSRALNIDNGCETVIAYGTSDWSPGDVEQAVGRVFRCSQAYHVLAIFLRVRGSASCLKITEARADKKLRAMQPFNERNMSGLRKRPRAEIGFEDEASDDEAEGMPWKRRGRWMRSVPQLGDDGCAPHPLLALQQAVQFGSLAAAPPGCEQETLAVLRGKKRACEFAFPEFPARGVSRFA